MKVATCQLPEVRNDPRRALSLVKKYARLAREEGASLVCFPECFLQGYELSARRVADVAIDLRSSELGRALHDLDALGLVVVVGLIERDGGAFYNSAIAIERGQLVARYRKTHLLEAEQSMFSPGEGPAVFDVAGVNVGINICYDLCFPDSVGRAADSGAEVLICPCSNMMPRRAAEAWKHRHNEIRCRHAQEHGVWIVSSDITGERDDWISYGPTAVIDPEGIVVDEVPLLETGMVVTRVR